MNNCREIRDKKLKINIFYEIGGEIRKYTPAQNQFSNQ
jgi:hypothetical protein